MSRRKRPIPQNRRHWPAALFVSAAIAVGVIGLCLQRNPTRGPSVADAAWVPPHPSNRWECIVIHHSASTTGGAEKFDKWHKAKGWDGLGYHFVIGNGTDTPDGKVEVGFRWSEQAQGAHCKTPDEFYNAHGIGICLVGNFDNTDPSPAQMQSLVRLCKFLCKRFNIPPQDIYTHGGVTNKTDCPGANFDLALLRKLVLK